MPGRAGAGDAVRSSRPDPASRRTSAFAASQLRRDKHEAVIEPHRRAADDDAGAGFAVTEGVLDGWIETGRGDGKRQTVSPPVSTDKTE
jgi:hypothetical protein